MTCRGEGLKKEKRTREKKQQKHKQAVINPGVFLVDLLKLDQPGKGSRGLYQDLISISAGKKMAVREYYVKKMTVIMILSFAGLVLTVGSFAVSRNRDRETKMQILERPGYGEGDRKESLSVQVEGEKDAQEMEITVQERKYTEEQKEELLDLALEELERLLPGENESLDEVRLPLHFPSELKEGAVRVSWIITPYGVLDEDGSILSVEDEKGVLAEITATLDCDGREAVYSSYVRVFPPTLPEQERFLKAVGEEVRKKDEDESFDETLKLPDTVEGKTVTWIKTVQNPFKTILALSLLLTVCICIQMDYEIHKKAEARKQQLLLDYPDLMWKLTMLLGAGLSIKGAFMRISQEYLREKSGESKKRRKKYPVRYVYEEVVCTCYEMQSGIPEAQAYERFGRRCQLPEYIRIGSVLSQNLKKGAKGLTSMLETEAEASLNDRKNNARKIGEQAGTKLLLPMVLMLGVVLAILMIPAFLSF